MRMHTRIYAHTWAWNHKSPHQLRHLIWILRKPNNNHFSSVLGAIQIIREWVHLHHFFMKNKNQKLFCLDLDGISCLWTLETENATRVLDRPVSLYPQAPETRLWTTRLSLGVSHELSGLKGPRKWATYLQDKPSFSKGPLECVPSPQRILCVLNGKASF